MEIKEYISEFVSKHEGNDEKMEELSSLIEDFFEHKDYAELKEKFKAELEELVYEIDEDMAELIIEHLKHRDGSPSGLKWTLSEVDNVIKQNGVEDKVTALGKKFCNVKFWLAMNYVYAVHYNINRTINGYIDLAIDELTNKNLCFDSMIRHVYKKIY